MPTKHTRVAVTLDEELAAAIARVEALEGRRMPRARLVRELALRGATSIIEDDADRQEKLERLAELSTTSDELFDRDVLRLVDEEAWRQ